MLVSAPELDAQLVAGGDLRAGEGEDEGLVEARVRGGCAHAHAVLVTMTIIIQ